MIFFNLNFWFFWTVLILLLFGCMPEKMEEPPQELEKIIKRNAFHADTTLQNIYNFSTKREAKEIIRYFKSSKKEYHKHAALAFASLQDSTFLPDLMQLLDNENTEVRLAAATAIGQFWATSSEDTLIKKVNQMQKKGNYDVKVQKRLLEAIGKSATIKGLRFLVSKSYQNDTLRAGQTLGIYRAATKPKAEERVILDSATVMLLDFLTPSKQSYTVRLMASSYFARLADKVIPQEEDSLGKTPSDFFEILKNKADKDSQAFVRSNAAKALGAIKTEENESFLVSILDKEDENYLVKISAIRSLIKFDASPTIQKALSKQLEGENPNLKVVAAQALAKLARLSEYQTYINWAKKSKNFRTRALLLGGAIQTEKQETTASDIAISILDSSKNSYEKVELLKALSQNDKNIDLILDTLKNTSSPILKAASTEGIINISTRFLVQNPELKFNSKEKVLLQKIKESFETAIQSEDVGAVALAAFALTDEKTKKAFYKYRSQKILTLLKTAKQKLSLPKEIETYQALNEAIAFYSGKKQSRKVKRIATKAIDWKFISTLDARQSVTLKTNKGEITVSLFTEETPATVANFVELIETGFYNQKKIHRVVPNFVVQGGDPRGDGWGSVDFTIPSEFSTFYYDDEGYLGMASAGKDTESCQFFITHSPTPHLDGRYTIFGKVLTGMEVVHRLEVGDYIETVSF